MILLSLTDLVKIVKKNYSLILICGLIFSCAAFLHLLKRPIHFTAQGLFKGHVAEASTPLFKALEFFGEGESYSSSDDPRTFLRSYPVLERVVRALNLQATLTEETTRGRVWEIWYTLKTAYAYRIAKKHRPPSSILSSDVFVSDKLIIPDFHPFLVCSSVDFPSETAQSLSVHFLDEETFEVFDKPHNLGTGRLGAPFLWGKNSFTLSGKGEKGKSVGLHFIPLPLAIKSLQGTLQITRIKEHASLVPISYTHRDRHLAATIVNETMKQFEVYLQHEGKKKITKQLAYLRQRQEETIEHLEAQLERQKAHLTSHLDAGAFLSLEKELEYMAKTQVEKRQEMLHIRSEIEHLTQKKYNHALSFSEIQTELKRAKNGEIFQTLSLEGAHECVQKYQQELDGLCLDKERYEYCLRKLKEADFDSSSLAKMLNDLSLQPRFENIYALQRQLIDEKNWTTKERGTIKTELEIEKHFIAQHVNLLKDGTLLHEKVLKERIASLQETLVFLLLDRYEQAENTLDTLRDQAVHFPQKWLTERKIELNTKLYTEMMESLTKMIEAKNINYNLDYLMSNTFKYAVPPLFPDPPHLLLGMVLGGGAGICLALLGLCFYQTWRGPSASATNLLSQGYTVIPQKELIPFLGLAIAQRGPIVLLTSQQMIPFSSTLTDWLTSRGESLFTIDLTSQVPDFMHCEEREAFLSSKRFQDRLATFKEEYDRIVIITQGTPQSFETQILTKIADTTLYGVSEEQISDLASLPQETLFFMQEMPPLKIVSSLQITLSLERLFSSFSQKIAKRSLSKKP